MIVPVDRTVRHVRLDREFYTFSAIAVAKGAFSGHCQFQDLDDDEILVSSVFDSPTTAIDDFLTYALKLSIAGHLGIR